MFTFRKKRVYLDHAAATPPTAGPRRVFDEASALYGNPSSRHLEGVRARKELERARTEIARLLDVRAGGITFTSGATEANNLALLGYVEALRTAGMAMHDMHVLYHPGAHASITETIESIKNSGAHVEELSLASGDFNHSAIRAQLKKNTVLVVVEAVSGETGMVFATRELRRTLDAYSKEHGGHIHMHVDASQAPRAHAVSLVTLGADTLSLDAQKIGGVRGCGVLARTHQVHLNPIMYGGGQESGVRPGTENPALAASCARALTEACNGRDSFVERAQVLREQLIPSVTAISGSVVHTGKNQVPHIVSFSLPGRDTEYLMYLLDARGFAVSTKSACEGESETSRMVLLMTGSEEYARSTLRVSFGPHTTKKELSSFIRALTEAVRFLDQNALK